MNTKNNWLQYFYVDVDWQPSLGWMRTDPEQQCSMLITPYEFEVETNLWQSILMTAQEISSKFGNIQIGYSGGLDSEMAVLAFHSLKLPFRISTIHLYWDDKLLNGHDVKYAHELCKQLDRPVEVIKFDLRDLVLGDEWARIATTYQAVSPYQHVLLKVLEKVEEPWLQVDEIETLMVHDDGAPYWAFEKREDQDMCWRKFNGLTGIPALNNFFTYRLETVDAWFRNSTVNDLVNNRIPGKLSFTTSKHRIYQQDCPYTLERRPKYFGLESMTGLWDNNIVDRLPVLEISDHMYVKTNNILDIINSKDPYSNVYYKKSRLPRSI
jgi:hypothetical protein